MKKSRVPFRKNYAIAAGLMGCVATGVWASGPEPVAVLTQIKGVVAVSKGQAFVQAHKVMVLEPGDSVLALDGGEATVLYAGGCYEHLSPNTMLTLHTDGMCKDDIAEAVDVGPLYASAIGAIGDLPKPSAKKKHGPVRHAPTRSGGQGALGASGGFSSASEPKQEATTLPSVTVPPPLAQPSAPAAKPAVEAAVANAGVPAPVNAPEHGPVISVPDVMGDDGGMTNTDILNNLPGARPKPVAAVETPVATKPAAETVAVSLPGVARTPASQGALDFGQALAVSKQDRDDGERNSRDKERERAKLLTPPVPVPPAPMEAPVARSNSSERQEAKVTAEAAAQKPAAAPSAAPAQKPVSAPSAAPANNVHESAEKKANSKWKLGEDGLDLDGPRMFTNAE